MAIEWFYAKNGTKNGPVSPAQLQELANAGQLLPNDMIWKEGMAQWVKASSIKGLFLLNSVSASPPPPPLPPRELPPTTAPTSRTSAFGNLNGTWRQLAPVWKIIIGGSILFCVFSFCCCGIGIVTIGRDESERSRAAEKAAKAEKIGTSIPVDAVALIEQYKNNEVSADRDFKGKTLDVSGRIHTIGRDLMNTGYVTLESGRQFEFVSVQCFFDARLEGELAALQKGQWITIRGKCGGKMMNVMIKSATIVGK